MVITNQPFKRGKVYYTHIRYSAGKRGRKRISLGTSDRQAACTKANALQREADRLSAGVFTPEQRRLELPLAALLEQFGEHLTAKCSSVNHITGSLRLVERIFAALEWTYWRQIDATKLLTYFTQQQSKAVKPWTPAYCNTFLKALKSFTVWATPENGRNPLTRLSRLNTRNARQTRAKRAADREERELLVRYWDTLPWNRQATYYLAMFNGLRRNEIEKLSWQDVVLNSTVPFIRNIKQKMGDGVDQIPLHPKVIDLLTRRLVEFPAIGGVNIVSPVPDDKTVRKDVPKAGVAYTDAWGRILSLHALRHTFCTMLGLTPGITNENVKGLMRHSKSTVTEGYLHSGLADMREALDKAHAHEGEQVPQRQEVVRTGTDSQPLSIIAEDWHQIWHHPSSAQSGLEQAFRNQAVSAFLIIRPPHASTNGGNIPVNTGNSAGVPASLLSVSASPDTLLERWPDTQVD